MLRLSILAVDDSPLITEMIKDAFEAEGYRVLTAEDGTEALKVALAENPDIIIADVNMPGMDGWELCSQIRSNPFTSFIPFIFLTSRVEAPDRIRGIQMGADDYLTKPFEMEELIARVHLIFQRIRKTQESLLLREKKSLSGSTKEMALPDLLQMFGLNQKTGMLRITRMGFPPGVIAVENGRIIRAELGPAHGAKAIYRLLLWHDAHFEMEPLLDSKTDPGMPQGVEEVLMEGMRQLDELKVLEQELPLVDKRLRIAAAPPASELSPREEALIGAVKKLGTLPEVLDEVPWTDFEVYRMLAYFIRKGVIAPESR